MISLDQILIAALGTSLAALMACTGKVARDRVLSATGIVRIALPDNETLPANGKLMLLHVRDGKDEVSDKGPLKNQVQPFTLSKGRWFAKAKYQKALGFQFKCHIDASPEDETNVLCWLEQRGFQDVSIDETRRGRIWFLLPDMPTCETVDGYVNNFFHPNRDEVLCEVIARA